MKVTRILPTLALPIALSFALVGCGVIAAPTEPDAAPETSETEEAPAPADGDIAPAGTTVGLDTYLTYDYTGVDDVTAVISAKLVSVEPVTDAQLKFLNEQFDQLAGYDVYLVTVDQKKESGDPVIYNADYTNFKVVDAEGTQVQGVTLIGWDECSTESFDEPFDTEGAVLTQCFIGASPAGGNAPAGVAYTGGYEDTNPYKDEPLLFIK